MFPIGSVLVRAGSFVRFPSGIIPKPRRRCTRPHAALRVLEPRNFGNFARFALRLRTPPATIVTRDAHPSTTLGPGATIDRLDRRSHRAGGLDPGSGGPCSVVDPGGDLVLGGQRFGPSLAGVRPSGHRRRTRGATHGTGRGGGTKPREESRLVAGMSYYY